jgi:hypothetical protein
MRHSTINEATRITEPLKIIQNEAASKIIWKYLKKGIFFQNRALLVGDTVGYGCFYLSFFMEFAGKLCMTEKKFVFPFNFHSGN